MNDWQIELTCAECGRAEAANGAGIAKRLLAAGLLRSHSEATPDELRELALALAGKLPCSSCGQVGLKASVLADDTQGWLEARRCEDCGNPIDPDRLEVFPDAKLCASCKREDERHVTPPTGEFCPRCGSPMVVQSSTGQGVHRYILVCPPCRSR